MSARLVTRILLAAAISSYVSVVTVAGNSTTTIPPVSPNYACFNCLKNADGKPATVRAMFIQVDLGCENPKAKIQLAKKGELQSACNDPQKAVPECFVAKNWNYGWICEATDVVFENLGVNVVAMTKANFTSASAELYKGGSSYTRCIYEIIVGNVDICVSDFWQTTERSGIAAFTTGVDGDSQVMITMPIGGAAALLEKPFSTKDITGKNIIGILGPFTYSVWGITFGYFIFGGLLLWLVEGIGQNNKDYLEVYENPTNAKIGGMLKSIYSGVMDYWLAGPTFLSVSSWPGRICVLGYGFFIFITCTSYTANLVNFMVSVKVPRKTVNSLNHLVEMNGKLCMLEAAAGSIMGAYMLKEENVLACDDYGCLMENLFLGRCQASVLGKNEYLKFVKAQQGDFDVCTDDDDGRWWTTCKDESILPTSIRLECTCKDFSQSVEDCPEQCPTAKRYCPIQRTDPDFYFEFTFALPVGSGVENYVSAWLNKLVLSGEMFSLRKKYVVEKLRDVCSDEKGKAAAESLGMSSFIGVTLISFVFIMLGLLIHVVQLFLYREVKASSVEAKEEAAEKKEAGEQMESTGSSAVGDPITSSLSQLNRKAIELRQRMEAFKPRRAPNKALVKRDNGDAMSTSGFSISSAYSAANANPESIQGCEVPDLQLEYDPWRDLIKTVSFGAIH